MKEARGRWGKLEARRCVQGSTRALDGARVGRTRARRATVAGLLGCRCGGNGACAVGMVFFAGLVPPPLSLRP